jgi:hypothetical protein
MSSDFDSSDYAGVMYTYDASGRLVDQREATPEDIEAALGSDTDGVRLTPIAFERDKDKRLFKVAGPDGKTELFRDNPTRFLLVEPDPESGEMQPVIQRGRPAFIYLCREERER